MMHTNHWYADVESTCCTQILAKRWENVAGAVQGVCLGRMKVTSRVNYGEYQHLTGKTKGRVRHFRWQATS